MQPIDHQIRQQAMDPSVSAIVSAPAGSGKTYLLTRRMINLLLQCQQPEHVIAITFTKKAANEMRERLIQCIKLQEEDNAKKLLQHAQKHQWDLLAQTHKLQIMTIDSFCSWLLQRASPQNISPISASPTHLYQTVVYQYFQQTNWNEAQYRIMRVLNGNYQQAESLLVQLLSMRDQWQPHLSMNIKVISLNSLAQLRAQQVTDCEQSLGHLLPTIAQLIKHISKLHQRFGDQAFEYHCIWGCLSELLLTKQGSIRSKLTKAQGIYPKSMTEHTPEEETKQLALSCVEEIKLALEQPSALSSLQAMQLRPEPQSIEEQAFLDDLTVILTQINQRLSELFVSKNRQDFTQIALHAVTALKTDPLLQQYCHDHIHHILMDEFQDTSSIQYEMAQSIVKNWPKETTRTIFAVGDPMQSIYRFRQADVRLFIKTQQEPIAHIQTTPLFLECNFRSSTKMIEAINDHFQHIFPAKDHLLNAAIRYREATPTKPSHSNAGIYLEYEENETPFAQAQRAINIIKQHQKSHPESSIGVLAQTRSHLKALISLLESQNITFNAIDIYPLGKLAAINDLCALLGYLYDANNQIAWQSILRSPLCGLNLNDLYANKHQTELSEAGYFKLSRLLKVIQNAKSQQVDITKQCALIWKNLSADALYPDTQAPAITKWFDEVIQLRANQLRLNQQTLINHFARSHMSIIHANCYLNLLTAHKSKGLEYDHVIIMHTEKRSQSADIPMLYAESSPYPLIQPTFLPNNTNTAYLKQLNKKRDEFESMRLLYVAATRAKHTLHLISHPGKTTSNWINAFEITSNAKHTYSIHQHTNAEHHLENAAPVLSYHLETPQLRQPQTSITDFTVQANEYGTSLHFLLEHYQDPHLEIRFNNHLLKMGYDGGTITLLKQYAKQAISNIQNSTVGQWIFKSRPHTYTEHTLDFEHTYHIIDRMFIEDSTLWIIDFKFHQQQYTESDLHDQHHKQLQSYILAAKQHFPMLKIKAMLYLPLSNQTLEINHSFCT